jgi:hypothetical protein
MNTTTKPAEHIMQFFETEHLSPKLQAIAQPFCDLARAIVGEQPESDPPVFVHQRDEFGTARGLPRNPERTVALRKLLEAKDAAVRAFIAK